MSVGGSQQLRIFRIARREGATIEDAAARAGIGLAEARLHAADDERNPPPPEAFELLNTTQSPGTAAPDIAGLQTLHAGRDCSAPLTEHPASLAPRTNQNTNARMENDMTDIDDDAPDFELPAAKIAADTMRGDIRDVFLNWFKATPKPWDQMSEQEQRDFAAASDRAAGELIKQACKLIAAAERPSIMARLVEYKEKDGVEAKLELPSTGDVVAALHEVCGREVLLVASGEEEFQGQAADAQIDADQLAFPNLGEEYDEAA